ncbi:hypothetical protein L195_g063878, partial [Trifolium pratense]
TFPSLLDRHLHSQTGFLMAHLALSLLLMDLTAFHEEVMHDRAAECPIIGEVDEHKKR